MQDEFEGVEFRILIGKVFYRARSGQRFKQVLWVKRWGFGNGRFHCRNGTVVFPSVFAKYCRS
jgi:hypothetical protein